MELDEARIESRREITSWDQWGMMFASCGKETPKLAARNIAQAEGHPSAGSVLVVCSKDKIEIAESILKVLEEGKLEHHLLRLGSQLQAGADDLGSRIKSLAGPWGLLLLLQPEHAGFLFETVGRPDRGIRIPTDHLFCDWLIRPPSLIRTCGIDVDELH